MERLTERIKRLQKDDLIVYTKGKYEGAIPAEMTNDDIRAVLKKLAAYEDLEEQGLLVRLPCKVGDDVYIIPSPTNLGLNILAGHEENNRVYHQHIGSITFTDGHWYATSREEYGVYNEKVLNDIAYGITWFTDYEEAEKKLEEMKNGL